MQIDLETLRGFFRKAPFMADLGVEPLAVSQGKVTTQVVVQPKHLQHTGVVHAGVLASLAAHKEALHKQHVRCVKRTVAVGVTVHGARRQLARKHRWRLWRRKQQATHLVAIVNHHARCPCGDGKRRCARAISISDEHSDSATNGGEGGSSGRDLQRDGRNLNCSSLCR